MILIVSTLSTCMGLTAIAKIVPWKRYDCCWVEPGIYIEELAGLGSQHQPGYSEVPCHRPLLKLHLRSHSNTRESEVLLFWTCRTKPFLKIMAIGKTDTASKCYEGPSSLK